MEEKEAGATGERRSLMRPLSWLLVLALVIFPVIGFGIELEHGAGFPELEGWRPLDWLASCSSGTGGLTDAGLQLLASQAPPPSGLEFSLKLLPYKSLLFSLYSQQATGGVRLLLDGKEIGRIKASKGDWWIRVDELPKEGLLRLELDRYSEGLLVRGVYVPGMVAPPPECLQAFLAGVVVGGITVLVLCHIR